MTTSPTPHSPPVVRAARFDDLTAALVLGWADFRRAPAYGIFFGAVYAVGGLSLMAVVFYLNMAWMAYPLVIGFALIGPFVATGLYEVSRRLEDDQELSWSAILNVIWAQHRREFGWMAFVILFVFWIWIYQVRTLVAVFFGFQGFATLQGFIEAVFTTSNGLMFLAVGHVVGAALSLVLFSLTVVSCPLLLERDVDFVTAMLTSIRAVTLSPFVMAVWGASIVLLLLAACLPLFIGLPLVLPVFGHATWHLYRRLIVPE